MAKGTKSDSVIKLKLSELKNMESTLLKLFGMDLPVDAAYALSKLMKLAKAELETLETLRTRIVEKYGKEKFTQEDGRIVVPAGTPEFDNYQADLDVLMAKQVVLNFPPLNLSTLPGIKLSTIDIFLLDPILTH